MSHLDNQNAFAGMISPAMATADTLFELGLMYCIGREVEQDYVTAHKWFNLAAMKGSDDARVYRCEIAREMSASQVHEAQKMARAWMTVH